MKRVLILSLIALSIELFPQAWIRVNQLGYLPESIKQAVFVTKENIAVHSFSLHDALTNEVVFESGSVISFGSYGPFTKGFRLDFSEFKSEGGYYISCAGFTSPNFIIKRGAYNSAADFLLKYMRQQRCGYNPFLKDSCHTNDGYIIYHPTLDSTYIDVKGGWHDASDYLQYVTTSANAVYQMLFAYEKNPIAFGDQFNANGNAGANGIPDILDEAKWGIDWLLRMNPTDELIFNQIADDRDHQSFRLPTQDNVSYGKGKMRPVYFINGLPQGVMKYQNRTTGKASSVGKFSSAFALASEILKQYYPELQSELVRKAINAYKIGLEFPGVSQTAPCRAPYFYEEDNWADDMELAAITLYQVTGEKKYYDDAVKFGGQEPFTPWMGADTARHYQWYPFVNLGHYKLGATDGSDKEIFLRYLKEGIERVVNRGKDNPFLNGIPFIWCSNNLVAAFLTQAKLYRELTSNDEFLKYEIAMLDWLFGVNPWGTSMIVGLPKYGISPKDPHSAFTHLNNYPIDGGLVDGPIYSSIFNSLIGIHLSKEDQFAGFQSDLVVYHDDWGDYSTNEPTMDGTASLSYYFSSLYENVEEVQPIKYKGAITRFPTDKKEIYLVFTGHEFADGHDVIKSVLSKHNLKANFFFTGDFYRNKMFEKNIVELKNDGHYLGAHSDKHLLYADWTKRDSTLISKKDLIKDISDNYSAMKKFGIEKDDAGYFLPPYEWYNEEISYWASSLGLKMINFTGGTNSNQDWTIPELGEKYFSSVVIFNNIINFEKSDASGLNGFILLLHYGTHPSREDKFYYQLDKLISELMSKGYSFKRL